MNTIIFMMQQYFLYTLAMISNSCCDWNPAEHAHMTHVTKKLVQVFNQFRYLPTGIYWSLNTALAINFKAYYVCHSRR